jgi:glycosyltransferase involved in cell wall biosynthesis
VRIAIVSDFYLDYVGGLQTSIRAQTAALEAAGHTVVLISLARRARGVLPNGDLELAPTYTVPGVVLPVRGAGRQLVTRLADHLTSQRIDVVHLQTEFGLAHAAVRAAAAVRVPVVHTVHTFYWQSTGIVPVLATPLMRYGLSIVFRQPIPRERFTPRAPDNLLRNVTLATARLADVVVSPSTHQADDLRRAGIRRVASIPNPVAAAPGAPGALTAEQVARPRILWVGRCEAEKRPLVFAEAALEALRRTGGAFEVDMVGSGAQLNAVKALVHDEPLVRVHGGLDHGSVIELIDASSAVAVTSFGFDNQPMTIAEAVSRYRGVLYCDPRLREGLTRSGRMSSSPDAAAIAATMAELMASPADLLALSAGARTDAATFSSETYVERILTVYATAGVPSRPA